MNDASGRTGRSMSIDRWLQVRPGNEMAVALGGGGGTGIYNAECLFIVVS